MIEIKAEHIRVDSNLLTKVFIDFDCAKKFDLCSLEIEEVEEIIATTKGTIKKNEILISESVKSLQVYLKPKTDVLHVAANFFNQNKLIECETKNLTLKKIGEEELNFHSPVVFTGKKGMELFDNRIKDKITNWSATFAKTSNELLVKINECKRPALVCFGTLEKEIRANDITFTIEPEIKVLSIPNDLLVSRFSGQEVALHALVKPDFQKKIKNLYYKTKVSDSIVIEKENVNLRSIADFKDPVDRKLDPLKWVINYKTQLPEYVGI